MSDTLGARIAKARWAKQLTQRKLAQAVGISGNYLCLLEKGEKANPGALVVRDIAQVLEVSTDYLLGLVDEHGEKRPPVAAVGARTRRPRQPSKDTGTGRGQPPPPGAS